MIIASTLFLIVGIVTFVIGVFARDDVGLIVVSIGASAVAALTLAVGVVRDRKRLAAEGLGIPEASTFTEAAPTPGEPVATIVGEDTATITTPAVAPALDEESAPIVLPLEEEKAPTRESASMRAARASVAKAAAKKPAAKKASAKKPAAKKKAAPKKPAAKKPAAKKPAAKKPAAKAAPKPAVKKPAAKKPAAKKPAAKKAAPKKSASKKSAAKKTSAAPPPAEGAAPPPPPPPPPPTV